MQKPRPYWFLGLLFLGLLSGCSKDDIHSGQHIIVLGHGGVGWPNVFKNLPMNSMEAIEAALVEEQADGVELDVQLSSDSVLILFHDGKLENGSDCEGCIVDNASTDLFNCHHKKVLWGTPEDDFNLIGLEEVLSRFGDSGEPPWLSLDLKVQQCETDYDTYIGQFARQLVTTFEGKPYVDQVVFESQNLDLLAALHALAPDFTLFANFGEVTTLLEEQRFENEYDWLDGVIITLHNITREEVDQLHALDMQVSVFGVKLKGDVVEASEKDVDMMQVEKISMTLETLGKK